MFGGTSLNASRMVGFPQGAANTSWAATVAARFLDHTKFVAAPTPVTPAEQVQALSATPISANELPRASYGFLSDPSATTEQSTAPNALASLDPADRAIAEKIQELLATKLETFLASKKERVATAAFYENRNLAPLWFDRGVENTRASSVIARMKNAETDGLDPGDYRVPNFGGLGPDARAEAELKLTEMVLTYARHLQAGRFGRVTWIASAMLPPRGLAVAQVADCHPLMISSPSQPSLRLLFG
jgi:hypothetical protein